MPEEESSSSEETPLQEKQRQQTLQATDYDYVFKVVVVGDSFVGKTSLIHRYVDHEAPTGDYKVTLGVEFKIKTLELPDLAKVVKMQMWDTAGQERFHSLTRSFWRRAAGIIIVFAVDSRDSFTHIATHWLPEVETVMKEEGCSFALLIGNKCDLPDEERVVTADEARRFAREHDLGYVETSALTSENVERAFYKFAHTLTKRFLMAQCTHGSPRKPNGVEMEDPPVVLLDYNQMRQMKKDACGC